MNLELTKPLILFDLETTGVDPARDRIVEMSFIKVHPNGERETKTRRINPGIAIPEAASAIHGIKNEDVAEEPRFCQIARSLYSWIEGCDLAGYNSNKFDVPMLVEEFLRADVAVDLGSIRLVDVQNIFHKKEQRTLSAAYKFYCNKEIVNAHSAAADIEATYEVLLAQLERYDDLKGDIDFLSDYSKMGRNLDFAGRIGLDDNDEPIFNFGKHKGRLVKEIFAKEPSYYDWIIKGDFTLDTKRVVGEIKKSLK